MRTLVHIAFALAVLAGAAHGQQQQEQKFLVAVDTAGIMEAGPNVYTTWVFALSSPTSYPSSGIMVAWDCANKKVRRLAHVVYQWNDTKTGVAGPIVEDNLPWVEVTDQRLYDLVCRIGPTHGPSVVKPTKPEPKQSDPNLRIS